MIQLSRLARSIEVDELGYSPLRRKRILALVAQLIAELQKGLR